MSAPRGPRLSALLWMSMLAATLVAVPASAQFLDGARQVLNPFPRQNERTPRLLGMGKLTLADDRNNQMGIWDIAGNPLGIWEADSMSEAQVRPLLESANGSQDLTIANTQENQTLAAHGAGLGYELFHRTPSGTAYGAYGTLNGFRVDRPYDADTGLEHAIIAPNVTVLLSGKMPYLAPGHMRWMGRAAFNHESVDLHYHQILTNPGGSYVGLPGDEQPPPDLFTPETYSISSTGIGLGVSYRFGRSLTLGVNGDNVTAKVRGENTSVRHLSQTSENRPYWIGEGSAVGKLGSSFDYVVDGKLWRARNEERWNFTLAAGVQQEPLTGRGFMLQRTEDGSSLRGRLRWTKDALVLGAGVETRYGMVEVVGPRSDDLSSFNHFLNFVSVRQNADSLVLPDSVRSDAASQRNVAYSGGATYRLGWRSALAAAEFHWDRQRHDQRSQGEGPEGSGWDVRGGLEVPCTPILTGRAGYIYRTDDFDSFTARNEYLSHTFTAGASLAHPGSRWQLDAGYAYTWSAPDFPDAYEGWSGRQQFAAQIAWVW
jgi:hypothetical protein